MVTVRKFKNVLLLLIVCMIAGGFGAFFRYSLPPELQDYKHAVVAADRATGSLSLLSSVSAILSLAYIVSIIGLYRLRPFARPLFAASVALNFLVLMFFGPRVETRFISTFDDAITLINGVILALLYWSPLRDKFTKLPANVQITIAEACEHE